MKRLFYMIKKEINYLYYSKIILILILLFFGLNVINLWGKNLEIDDNYKWFIQDYYGYLEDGLDPVKALMDDAVITKEISNGSITVSTDNSLKCSYIELADSIYLISPKYFNHNALELITFVFGPLVFTIFGAYFANYDYHSKVIQIKAVQDNWVKWIIAKQVTLLLSIAFIIIIVLAITQFASLINYQNILHKYNANTYVSTPLALKSSIITKAVISIVGNFLFAIIGFALAILTKGTIVPVLLSVAYNVLIPVLGKYDLKNLYSVIGHKIFEFHSFTFQLFEPIAINSLIAGWLIISFIICFCITSLFIAKYQSKYVS